MTHHRTHHRHPHQAGPVVDAAAASGPATASPMPALDESGPSLSLTERKARLVERIERQRLLRQTRRIQQAIAALQAGGQGAAARGEAGFPRSKTLRAITGQPLLAVGALGVVLMMGPSRLMRLASWVVPMLLRRR